MIREIYQGDSLLVIVFVLALNPLSHLLRSTKGYAYGKNRHHQHTHNFFVYDLKLHATDINTVKKQLDIVTTFSKDTGMKFGAEKCVFLHVKIRLIKKYPPLNISNLAIQSVADGDSYKYKVIAYNSFAVPIITPTIGIID